MWSSPTDASLIRRAGTALLAAVAVGAWALPLVAPWSALLPVVGGAAAIVWAIPGRPRQYWIAAAVVTCVLALIGIAPSAVAASGISAAALALRGRPAATVALVGLALQTTAAVTMESSLGEALAAWGVEAAGPPLLAAAALAVVGMGLAWAPAVTAAISLLVASICEAGGIAPEGAMALSALPVIAAAAWMAARADIQRLSIGIGGALMVVALASWLATPPRSGSGVWVLLPDAPRSYEAQYFANYGKVLQFAGLDASVAHSPEEIADGATVLLPWLSAPLLGSEENDGAARIGELARARGWTVIALGEHTGYGEVDRRAATMARRPLYRRDLTVPPRNGDTSGPLRAADASAWPQRAILNRGATVVAPALSGRVLLAGDGWWAEPDFGEWLWTGDYVWRPEDRGGRIALVASFDDENARWIAVGDNSPFINRQLTADPRPALRLVAMSTLVPAFELDAALGIIAAVLIFVVCVPRIVSTSNLLSAGAAVALAISAFAAARIGPATGPEWTAAYVGQTGFDERNFNIALAEQPDLALSGWTLKREPRPVSRSFERTAADEILFALVEDEAVFGEAHLSACWRLGSLTTEPGVRLMDAQVCHVDGNAEILLGSRDAAAAIAVEDGSVRRILILDAAFLSAGAPAGNRAWLLRQIGKERSAP